MRNYCPKCQKVESACFCSKINTFNNKVKVIILQHPSESKHALNTAILAHLSFLNSKIIQGEDFTNHDELNSYLKNEKCFLLFPDKETQKIEKINSTHIDTLIIIDGSWKKAKKIFFTSKNLQTLPRIEFETKYKSRYRIRKEPKEHFLSTIEATTYALQTLEKKDFSSVFSAFDYMIEYQINKMSIETFQTNYQEKK